MTWDFVFKVFRTPLESRPIFCVDLRHLKTSRDNFC